MIAFVHKSSFTKNIAIIYELKRYGIGLIVRIKIKTFMVKKRKSCLDITTHLEERKITVILNHRVENDLCYIIVFICGTALKILFINEYFNTFFNH